MASTSKVLAAKQAVPNAAATLIYTSPVSGKGTYVDACDFVCYGTGTHNVTTWIVPVGGSVANVNKHSSAKSVSTSATVSLTELAGRYLAAGSAIYMQASVLDEISVYMTGRELT
jgi:hypothetical protein